MLTVAEIAEMWRVSKMTIYRMVHAGDLPAFRVGYSFRIPRAATEAFHPDPVNPDPVLKTM